MSSLTQIKPTVPQTVDRPPCPQCAGKMRLALIEPSLARGFDQRSFKCSACHYSDKILISFP